MVIWDIWLQVIHVVILIFIMLYWRSIRLACFHALHLLVHVTIIHFVFWQQFLACEFPEKKMHVSNYLSRISEKSEFLVTMVLTFLELNMFWHPRSHPICHPDSQAQCKWHLEINGKFYVAGNVQKVSSLKKMMYMYLSFPNLCNFQNQLWVCHQTQYTFRLCHHHAPS